MTDALIHIDHQLFFYINNTLHTELGDTIMPLMRNKLFWTPLYVALAGLLLYRYKMQGLWIILLTVLVVILCDQVSSSVIKPLVGRLRPCNDPSLAQQVKLLVHCGAGKSFTSSHATNHFGVAVFLGTMLWKPFKWMLPLLLLWAATVSIAQVYVGVHFPLDVTGGALLGTTIGLIVYTISKRIFAASGKAMPR